MYLTHKLLDTQDDRASTANLTELADWYIFPVVNPDGYEYSWVSVYFSDSLFAFFNN